MSNIVRYLSYFLSAYSLVCVCVRIPSICRNIKEFSTTNKYARLYNSSPVLRVKISLYIALFFNICYTAVQFALAVSGKSKWYTTLTVYYFLLVGLRIMLLMFMNKIGGDDSQSKLLEWRLYGISGTILALMNIVLAVMVFFIVWKNKGFTHYYLITIALAGYTFTSLTMAIVSIVRYRKFNSPYMSASKAINLVCALVSLLSLETAMLASFGREMSIRSRNILISVTGLIICLIVLGIAIYMSTRAIKNINILQKEIEEEKTFGQK